MLFSKLLKKSLAPAMLTLLASTNYTPLALAESPSWQLRGAELMSDKDYSHAKFELRMYSEKVVGTTSTFFLWGEDGWKCGDQWNEIDIETIPKVSKYQSNPIWQTSASDCAPARRKEGLHGSSSTIYNTWVTYILEWTPDYIRWARKTDQGNIIEDRKLSRFTSNANYHASVQHIQRRMKFAFNIWSQGKANPDWLGDLNINAIKTNPVYQFVDYVNIYNWNGNSFSSSPSESFNFNNTSEIANFRKGDWNFDESKGYVKWSPNAMGIVDVGNGNKALWLGLFHKNHMRAPNSNEIPSSGVPQGGQNNLSFASKNWPDRCLHVGGTNNNSYVNLNACNGSNAQSMDIKSIFDHNRIDFDNSGQSLGAGPKSPGNRVTTWSEAAHTKRRVHFIPSGNHFQIKSVTNGLCVEATWSQTKWQTCDSNKWKQLWSIK